MAKSRTTYTKGQSGNPNGRPTSDECLSKILKQKLDEPREVVVDGKKVVINVKEQIAEKLIVMALKGDIKAIKETMDRTEGKATQKIEQETTFTNSNIKLEFSNEIEVEKEVDSKEIKKKANKDDRD